MSGEDIETVEETLLIDNVFYRLEFDAEEKDLPSLMSAASSLQPSEFGRHLLESIEKASIYDEGNKYGLIDADMMTVGMASPAEENAADNFYESKEKRDIDN